MRLWILATAIFLTVGSSPASAHSLRPPFRIQQHHEVDQPQRRHSFPVASAVPIIPSFEQVQLARRDESATNSVADGNTAQTSLHSPTASPSLSPAPAQSSTSETASVTRARNVTLPKPPTVIPSSAPSPVPTPLDTTLYALSGQCLQYITNLVASSAFMSCLPFSLLIFTSSAFKAQVLEATRTGNYSHINDLIAYTNSPAPSAGECDQQFATFYKQVSQKSNCAAELGKGSDRQAVAGQTRRGLGNYQVLRTASGLTNPQTGVYCYLEAISSERPDDLYLWMLTAGNILPSSSTPTCSPCSGLLMNHLGEWSSNTTSLNASILSNAVSTINAKCGASFITHVPQPAAAPSAGARIYSGSLWGVLGSIIACWAVVN